MKMKKLVTSVCASVLALSCCATVAFAESQSTNFKSMGMVATGSLECNFGFYPFAWDQASAMTVSSDTAANGYKVGVRLEFWGTKDAMSDFREARDASKALIEYEWPDVYKFRSIHSIQSSDGKIKYTEHELIDREGLSD